MLLPRLSALPLVLLFASTTGAAVLAACAGDPDPVSAIPATRDGGGGDGQAPPAPTVFAKGPSRGSAIAMSADDGVVVSVNRDAGSVTVFQVAYPSDGAPTLTKGAELQVGAEPWQVVLSPDGDAAFVVLRKDQKLVKITGLRSTPSVAGTVAVGSEPTGVALTPGGTRAWVANWVDGTLTGVDTATMQVASTLDLNAALVETRLVGDVKPRPALAHPRSVAISNDADADENDESVYVTEYFAQRTAQEAANGANADTAKSGLVYKIRLSDQVISTIRLAPVDDLGFADSNGGKAGCYPNQLQSITLVDRYAYVSSICASPKGPIGAVTTSTPANLSNVKTTTHTLVSVVDLVNDTEVAGTRKTLHKAFDELFVGKPDDGTRRYPATPADIAFVEGTGVAYVAANGADGLFRVKYDLAAGSSIAEVGSPTAPFVDLNPSGADERAGQNPIGVVLPHLEAHKRFGFVANDITRNVSVVDFNSQAVATSSAGLVATRASELPANSSPEGRVRLGKRFFDTAMGRWSLAGQGWTGCQACHVDGLTDNVTWFFARGPRQSTSLDGSFSKKDPNDQRIFNWTAIFDEVADFEGNTRGISGGVGAIVHTASAPPTGSDRIDLAAIGHANLAGSAERVVDQSNPLELAQPNLLEDWVNIKAYVASIRPPRRPSNLEPAKVAEGKLLFQSEGGCQGCHGGSKWTISTRFFTPSVEGNDALKATAWTPPAGFPAALLPAADQRFLRFDNGNAAAFDQIQCILRPVGTFGTGDALIGTPAELRQDMTTPGQGGPAQANGNGFNPPSLLGAQVGAPFLHGGSAATLESLFSTAFRVHYQALSPNLLTDSDPVARAAKVERLVSYLLSIDTETESIPIPTAGAAGGSFCVVP